MYYNLIYKNLMSEKPHLTEEQIRNLATTIDNGIYYKFTNEIQEKILEETININQDILTKTIDLNENIVLEEYDRYMNELSYMIGNLDNNYLEKRINDIIQDETLSKDKLINVINTLSNVVPNDQDIYKTLITNKEKLINQNNQDKGFEIDIDDIFKTNINNNVTSNNLEIDDGFLDNSNIELNFLRKEKNNSFMDSNIFNQNEIKSVDTNIEIPRTSYNYGNSYMRTQSHTNDLNDLGAMLAKKLGTNNSQINNENTRKKAEVQNNMTIDKPNIKKEDLDSLLTIMGNKNVIFQNNSLTLMGLLNNVDELYNLKKYYSNFTMNPNIEKVVNESFNAIETRLFVLTTKELENSNSMDIKIRDELLKQMINREIKQIEYEKMLQELERSDKEKQKIKVTSLFSLTILGMIAENLNANYLTENEIREMHQKFLDELDENKELKIDENDRLRVRTNILNAYAYYMAREIEYYGASRMNFNIRKLDKNVENIFSNYYSGKTSIEDNEQSILSNINTMSSVLTSMIDSISNGGELSNVKPETKELLGKALDMLNNSSTNIKDQNEALFETSALLRKILSRDPELMKYIYTSPGSNSDIAKMFNNLNVFISTTYSQLHSSVKNEIEILESKKRTKEEEDLLVSKKIELEQLEKNIEIHEFKIKTESELKLIRDDINKNPNLSKEEKELAILEIETKYMKVIKDLSNDPNVNETQNNISASKVEILKESIKNMDGKTSDNNSNVNLNKVNNYIKDYQDWFNSLESEKSELTQSKEGSKLALSSINSFGK